MVVEHLERTRDAFVAAARNLSEAQYRFRTEPDRWSIGEIVEHVAIAERRIVDMLVTKMAEAPPPAGEKARGAARFARLDAIIPSRAQRRITAPDALKPTGTFADPAAALAAFVAARNEGLAAAAAAGPDTADRVLPHRLIGEMDLEEWLYFCGAHVARHTEQIVEIRAAEGFPDR